MLSPAPHQVCAVCIMDSTDPDIQFFGAEGCSHCRHARMRLATEAFPGEAGEARLREIAERLKHENRNRPYDCLIGISGGADSSYVLVRAKELGLRPLALHLDNGWNAELAVHNIKQLVRKLEVDLVTHVIDWNEIRALQRACFKAPLLDIEIVSDHAIFAALFHTAAKHGIRYLFAGNNLTTESILPPAWCYDKRDSKHVMAVYRKYGEGIPLSTYPTLSPARFLYYIFVKGIRIIPLLNYGLYDKAKAVAHLSEHYDWRPYTNKHGESTFTRFYQDYYLPAKFGIDKRKAHLSSQVAAGQMTRNQALDALKKPLFAPGELEQEKAYVLKKLGFSEEEFARIMHTPAVPHADLPNNGWMFDLRSPVTRFIRGVAKQES